MESDTVYVSNLARKLKESIMKEIPEVTLNGDEK